MTNDIKKHIEEYKPKVNGFSQKDMMLYLMSKVDKIDEKLDSGGKKIAKNRQAISDIQKLLGGMTAFFLASFIALVNKFWR